MGGPGLGGLLVQLFGTTLALGITAIGSVLSALSLTRIQESFVPPLRGSGVIYDLMMGMRFLIRDRVLVGLIGFSAIANLSGQWVMLLFLVDGIRRLELSSGQIGLVLAVGAVGTLVGAATSSRVARRVGVLIAQVLSSFGPVVLFLLPIASPGWGTSVLIVALGAAMAVNGYAVGLSSVLTTTIRQTRVPDELLGRVVAPNRMVSFGSIALGAAIGGLVGQLLGVRTGLLLGCVGGLATTAWVLGWAVVLRRHGDTLEPA